MITPWKKRGFSAVLVIACLVVGSVFLLAGSSKNDNAQASSPFKAELKESFRPLPVYGANSINTWGPSWTDDAFRDSVASVGFKIVRYPGGDFGSYWDWRKGWFIDSNEAQKKGMELPVVYKKMKYSPTGLKELKLLVDETHCDVLFELNMITRDLDDQIEMLKNARSMGFPIKWIELGNEFNFAQNIGRVKFATPRDYGLTCYKWTKALKENFPGVQIGVIGGNRSNNEDLKNWNNSVLNEAANVDAIVAHVYPFPETLVEGDGINFKKLYNAFQDDFDRSGFNHENKKKIWLTEYNIHWAFVKPGPEGKVIQDNAFTWGNALSSILMTSECTNLPGNPPLIIIHGLANWRGFASVEKRNGRAYMLPHGIGFRAWCEACHNKNSLRQISFMRSNEKAKDFEVLGWQFRGGNGETSLLVNFTSNPVAIDIGLLNGADKRSYDLKYADKTKTINDWRDVTHERRGIKNNVIELPAYSIATL